MMAAGANVSLLPPGPASHCCFSHPCLPVGSQSVFFRVQADRISVYLPPPQNGAENGFFHLVSPPGHFR